MAFKLPMLLLSAACMLFTTPTHGNEDPEEVSCIDKNFPPFFERHDTHQIIRNHVRMCTVSTNLNQITDSNANRSTTPISLTKDVFKGETNDTEEVMFLYIECLKTTRVYFTDFPSGIDLSAKIGYIQTKNCDIYWHDINLFGQIVDLRVANLINKSNSFDEEVNFGYFNTHNTSTNNLLTLPLGLQNIGTMSIVSPRPNNLEVLFSEYEWPVMAEIDIWNYKIPFELELFRFSMPKLQSLGIEHCDIVSPLEQFPWHDEPMDLPRNIARTEIANIHYQLSTTVPRNVYRRFVDYPHNNIKVLSNVTFTGHVHQIKLSSNNLETLGSDTFSGLEMVQLIDLSRNKLTILPSGVFHNLTDLITLDLHDNVLEHIQKGIFLNNPHLNLLNMSHNSIKTLEKDAFVELTQLSILDMSHNQITMLPDSVLDMDRVINLQEVRFAANGITVIPEWAFLLRNVHTLDFSENPISWTSFKQTLRGVDVHRFRFQNRRSASQYSDDTDVGCYQPSGRIKRLKLKNLKHFETIDLLDIAQEEKTIFENILKCYELDFHGSSLFCDCNIYSFYLYLKLLSASNAKVQPITLPFMKTNFKCHQPTKLRSTPLVNVDPGELRCAQNLSDCPQECTCYSRVVDDRVIVDCENSNMTELPMQIPVNADTLLAAGNRLTKLEYGERDYMKHLNTLDLSKNKISRIEHEFLNYVASIRNLNLRGNRLGYLPKQESAFRNTTLTLGGNPWKCDCTTEWLKDWLIVRRKYIDIDDIICATGEGQGQRFLDVPRKLFVCLESVNAVLQVSLIIVSVFAVFLVIVIALMYKYRGEIKVLLYVHFNWHPFDRTEEADVLDKDYDVFISYSGYDFSSVVNNLLKYLETLDPPFTTCLHDRDFMVGAPIQDNIMESVRRSRRMVMVLTKNYLESDWCMLEFRAAHDRVLKDHTNYLILVLADDIPIDELEEDIQLYIRTNTYLALGNKWFFDKLRYVLPQVPLCNLKSDLEMTPKMVLTSHDHGKPSTLKV